MQIELKKASWRIIACVTLALSGCSKEGGRSAYAAQAEHDPRSTVPAPSERVPKIVGFGPSQVKAGEAFNEQPDGSSAIWLKLDQSMDGTDAVIVIDDSPLKTSISGNVATAIVPLALITTPGNHLVTLSRVATDGRVLKTASVTFVVTK